MRRLLVTGFGPFPGAPRNPSGDLARRVASDRRWARRGVEARSLVLETAYSAIEAALLPAIREFAPDAVLMLGVAPRRRRATPEARAVNRASRRHRDASGVVGTGFLSLDEGAPLVRRSRARVAALVDALRARGVAAALSRNAGRYLCNAAYYAALGESAAGAAFICAFVHVPLPPGKPLRRRPGKPRRRTPDAMRDGIMDCAATLLGDHKYFR